MSQQVRAYTVQLMLGFGTPSTKHSKETLVSGPAITFFTSSLRCTVGGAAGGNRIVVKPMFNLHFKAITAKIICLSSP